MEHASGSVTAPMAVDLEAALARVRDLVETGQLGDVATEAVTERLRRVDEAQTLDEFEIAIVGTIKAGKSTLINALLGADIAATAVSPETAVLTRFRKAVERDSIAVTYLARAEWNDLWTSVVQAESETGTISRFRQLYDRLRAADLESMYIGHPDETVEFTDVAAAAERLKRLTSAKNPEHFFVKEITVSLSRFPMPASQILVDTPGLDDPVGYRSRIAEHYLDRAHGVLVCNSASALRGSELRTIGEAIARRRFGVEEVIVVATQLDRFSDPQNDWPIQRDAWLDDLEGPAYYRARAVAEKNLVATSAHVACLVARRRTRGRLGPIESRDLRFARTRLMGGSGGTAAALVEATGVPSLRLRLREDFADVFHRAQAAQVAEHAESLAQVLASEIASARTADEQVTGALRADVNVAKELLDEVEQARAECEDSVEELRATLADLDEVRDRLIADLRSEKASA